MKISRTEILAPAGDFECVKAAVRCGADAVYLGAKEFSARAAAENFTVQELKEAADYCRERGVKVYLTLNTVVFDRELERFKALVIQACKAKVDAIIVQSMGAARLIKEIAPKMPLHGSTQMTVHSPSGAKALYEAGFKRVVLAREMTKEEIRRVAQSCPVELEVFVHGALCMCMSGQCYLSAILGSRSGSRGACAQPCRLPFSVGNFKDGYALSLKDNSLVDHMGELAESGVASAKIEGRMKRPEYVAAAVTACRESRDNGFVSGKTRNYLTSVFSRSGFTEGYYTGRRGYEMFGTRQKEDVVAASGGLLGEIRGLYRDERQRVPLNMEFSAEINKPPELFVSDGENRVKITGDRPCERAVNRALTSEAVAEQLKKTGATPYYVKNIICKIEANTALPLSAINSLRRRAIEEIGSLRRQGGGYEIFENRGQVRFESGKRSPRKRYGVFKSARLGDGFKGFDTVFVPLFARDEDIINLLDRGFNVGVEIPTAMFEREEKIKARLSEVRALGIEDARCNTIGAAYLARQEKMRLHGSFRLNFTNTLDLLWAEEFGFEDAELSIEITLEQASKLGGSIPRGVVGYGYLPLMITRNCPNKSRGISCKDCGGQAIMQDRLGKKFILRCDGEATEIYNCVPLATEDRLSDFKNLSFRTYAFNVENYVESVETIEDLNSKILFSKDFTRGLYFRGVK